MKELHFDYIRGHFIDEQGVQYGGKRIGTAQGYWLIGCSTNDEARRRAIDDLVTQAEKKGADAYSNLQTHVFDSMQEYDATPYAATASAILYKNQ